MLAFIHYPHASQWHTEQKPHGEAVAHTTSGLGPVSALRCNNRSVNLTSSPDTSTSITLSVSLQVWGEVARWVQSATQAKSAEWSAPSIQWQGAWPDVKTLLTSSHPRELMSLGSHDPLEDPLKVTCTQAHGCPTPVTWLIEVRAQPIFHFPPNRDNCGTVAGDDYVATITYGADGTCTHTRTHAHHIHTGITHTHTTRHSWSNSKSINI